MNSWPRNRIIFVSVAAGVLVLALLIGFFARKQNPAANPVTLNVWGTVPKQAFDALSLQYRSLRPNVTINYSELDPDTYNDTLLSAFASGEGPDVFMLGNQDVLKNAALSYPATSTQFTAEQVVTLFPSAVSQNMVIRGEVYALPISMDTLALFYNRDLFDKAGIALPPQTWQDALTDIPKLAKVNAQGQLSQGAIALGGPESSVAHASDILSLLMLQNGTQMNTEEGNAAFADSGTSAQALRFYLDFANPASAAYGWSDSLGNSLDAFAAGRVAMMVGYASDIASIKSKSPFLNFAVVPMLQTSSDQGVNYASYKGLAVWRQSKAPTWAWDFIINSATNPTANQAYLDAAGEVPALRTNIAAGSKDSVKAMFAAQALSAKSWQVKDYAKMKEILSNAILGTSRRQMSPEDALTAAEAQLNSIR